MNYFDQDSDSSFEEMRTFLIGDEEEAEKASMSTIPFGLEELQEVPYYKRPLVQLFAVVGIGLPIILLVMAAFKGGSRPSIAEASPAAQLDQEKAKLVSALNEEREKIRQLELQNALYEQKMDVIVPEPKAKPKTTAKPKPAPVQTEAATPAPKPVIAQRNPQPVYQSPAPKPRRTQVITTPAPKPQPIVKAEPKPDPMQQWLAIADQGHYTTAHVTKKSSARLVSKEVPVIRQPSEKSDYPLLNDSQVSDALSHTALLDDGELVARINGKSRASRTVLTQRPKAASIARANTNIIDIGSSAKATLESAVVWSTGTRSQSNKKYLLRLKEDFENIIEGKKGSPLKADLKQKGDSDFWANVGSVVAPGVERALDSASDTLVVQNGSVFRTNDSRDPLASGISGVADGVSRNLNRRLERNQRETILSYFQLDSGKTVYLKAYEDISF